MCLSMFTSQQTLYIYNGFKIMCIHLATILCVEESGVVIVCGTCLYRFGQTASTRAVLQINSVTYFRDGVVPRLWAGERSI